MNERLEIASRVLGVVLNTNAVAPARSVSFALTLADDLINAEALTRRDEKPTRVDDSRIAAEIRTFIRELEQNKAPGVAVNYVIRELWIMLERNNARGQK